MKLRCCLRLSGFRSRVFWTKPFSTFPPGAAANRQPLSGPEVPNQSRTLAVAISTHRARTNQKFAAPAARESGSMKLSLPSAPSRPSASIAFARTREVFRAASVLLGLVLSCAALALASTPTAASPTISPKSGTYTAAQTVTLSTGTSGAAIYYTTNGATPTTSSALYSGPIKVSTNTTVKAISAANGYKTSGTASASYVIAPPAAAPTFSLPSAVYNSVQTLTMSDATSGATIYYTTNGTTPTTASSPYTGPISISTSTNFSAAAIAPGGSWSAQTKGWFDIILPTPAPVATPQPNTYNTIQQVKLTDSVAGAKIYYTLDGTYPTTSSPVYTGPITATTNTRINAIATATSYSAGPELVAYYTIVAPPPTITPQSGNIANKATVTMTDALPGATIYYTTDGSLPTTSSQAYTGPITISPAATSTQVFRAIAAATGYLQSSVVMSSFIVDVPAEVLAQTTVGSTPTRNIPANFLGLAMNSQQPALQIGQLSTGRNLIFRTLLNNLLVNATAPMLIRIEADDTQLSDIQADVEPLAELAAAVNVNYTLGVDMWNNNLPLAEAQAAAWTQGNIPASVIQAIEIGNEPDDYPYESVRPSTYSFAQYLAQFQQWQQGISATIGGSIPSMGPSMGQQTHWIPNTEAALIQGQMAPSIVSQHAYVGGDTQDGNNSAGNSWPADYLLTPAAAVTMPESFSKYAASAHKAGLSFRMGEINSFWGGISGISDTFSSTLWSIDYMFNFLANGVDGVNWNNEEGTTYVLFKFSAPLSPQNIAQFQLTQVNPLYYGLLAFSQVAGNQAQVLPVETTTTANVSIWATVDNTSTAHVVVLNKDENAAGNVEITLPGYTTGKVRYLTAAHYSSINGVTFGGQTFDGSPDGTIQGQLTTTTITAKNGVFTVPNVPVVSGAIIDFSH